MCAFSVVSAPPTSNLESIFTSSCICSEDMPFIKSITVLTGVIGSSGVVGDLLSSEFNES